MLPHSVKVMSGESSRRLNIHEVCLGTYLDLSILPRVPLCRRCGAFVGACCRDFRRDCATCGGLVGHYTCMVGAVVLLVDGCCGLKGCSDA